MNQPAAFLLPQCSELDLSRLARPRPIGVYFLVDAGEIVYVGQSEDVDARIALHVAAEEKRFNRAFWIATPVSELAATEGAFIRALNPRYCWTAPVDVGRDAEMLARFGLVPNDIARAAFIARRRAVRCGADQSAGRARRRRHRARRREAVRRALWLAVAELAA